MFSQLIAWVMAPVLVLFLLHRIKEHRSAAALIALLAGLVSVAALARLLGAGFLGVEPVFFLIILSGFSFGARFGFLVGALTLLVSAFISGGIGPWLPFQMLGAGLVGFGAGLIPKRPEGFSLVCYSICASFGYGFLVTSLTWPLLAAETALGYVAEKSPLENFLNYLNFSLFSGGLAWDLGRAITTSALILLTKKALLPALNRAGNRANFDLPKLAERSLVTEERLR